MEPKDAIHSIRDAMKGPIDVDKLAVRVLLAEYDSQQQEIERLRELERAVIAWRET